MNTEKLDTLLSLVGERDCLAWQLEVNLVGDDANADERTTAQVEAELARLDEQIARARADLIGQPPTTDTVCPDCSVNDPGITEGLHERITVRANGDRVVSITRCTTCKRFPDSIDAGLVAAQLIAVHEEAWEPHKLTVRFNEDTGLPVGVLLDVKKVRA